MCSDRFRLALGAAVVLALPLAAGCGKQGDPQPRPRNVPQPASDLSLRLRGDTLLLAFAYPASTVAGLPLVGLESATVHEIVQPLAVEAPLPRLTGADFEAASQVVRELSGRELADAVVGDRILTALRLPPGAIGAVEARFYAVRTKALHGEPSPWSNVVALRATAAPPAPSNLELEAAKDGILLRWTPVAESRGSVVLRREATEARWSAPLATLAPEAGEHLDRGALYGSRYIYTVLSLGGEDPPVESAPQIEREIDYRDVFPPETPTGLRGLIAAGQVRLIWDASPDADLAGYFVERSIAGGPYRRHKLGPIVGLEFTDDTAPPKARSLTYRLVAVDRAGNESPPTEPIELRTP